VTALSFSLISTTLCGLISPPSIRSARYFPGGIGGKEQVPSLSRVDERLRSENRAITRSHSFVFPEATLGATLMLSLGNGCQLPSIGASARQVRNSESVSPTDKWDRSGKKPLASIARELSADSSRPNRVLTFGACERFL
jgi:hypothetical protein